jgi:hypothetical protein
MYQDLEKLLPEEWSIYIVHSSGRVGVHKVYPYLDLDILELINVLF